MRYRTACGAIQAKEPLNKRLVLRPRMTNRDNSNGFADFVEDVRALDSPADAVKRRQSMPSALCRDRTQ